MTKQQWMDEFENRTGRHVLNVLYDKYYKQIIMIIAIGQESAEYVFTSKTKIRYTIRNLEEGIKTLPKYQRVPK